MAKMEPWASYMFFLNIMHFYVILHDFNLYNLRQLQELKDPKNSGMDPLLGVVPNNQVWLANIQVDANI